MKALRAAFQQQPTDPVVHVTVVVPDELETLPREAQERRLSELLHQVRSKPEFTLYGLGVSSSYVDPPRREALLGFNTRVEVSLPYCLHVPSDRRFDVTYTDGVAQTRAAIVLRKVWTDLAEGSNEAEIVADDQLLYYGPFSLPTPTFPQRPELGPIPRFAGRNVEIAQDIHGTLRYSRARVFFDTDTANLPMGNTEAEQEARATAIRAASRAAERIIGYFLDVYRYVTKEVHVQRPPVMTVNEVYFQDCNHLHEGASVPSGIGSAVVNRSRAEIEQIATILANGTQPEPHILLLQSAQAALGRHETILAVVLAFQSLEMFIEKTLRAAYDTQGVPPEDVTKDLKEKYQAKDRLTGLSRKVLGGSIADDTVFWQEWLVSCNRKRNGVVHRGEGANETEAETVVRLCEQCMVRLEALSMNAAAPTTP